MTVTVTATLTEVDGRRVRFDVVAHDGLDEISRGTHQRFVIDRDRFVRAVDVKRARSAHG
jgi:fluoroacetyl-CoA thioesterase